MTVMTALKRFRQDIRGAVQPEVIALTVSALLLGLTYVESVKQAAEDPPVHEEVFQRKCASTLVASDDGSSTLGARQNCE